MGPPKPGEWLYRFKEEHQSFDEYKSNAANVKDDKRRVVYLQPLGDALKRWPGVLEQMREYAGLFFHSEAKLLDPLPMFEPALAVDRNQYEDDIMIRYLRKRMPEDALMYIGITDKDLFSRGLNFVFGSGNLVNRCGVYSLIRLESKDASLFLRRSLGLMTHEAGHILGVTHCVQYHCLMNGANSLDESDRAPLYLCPEDLKKVQWNAKFDVIPRYEKILAFFKNHKLDQDAEWLENHLNRLR